MDTLVAQTKQAVIDGGRMDRETALRLLEADHSDLWRAADRVRDGIAANLAGDDLDLEADEFQGHHDVAEEHRGIHPVPAHRLQRDLARHGRIEARCQHVATSAQLSVLGKRSAGLPHEPHRGARGKLAAVGPNQR